MILSPSQDEAKIKITKYLKNYDKTQNMFILEGSAGTGKSTVITHILSQSDFSNKKIVYSATTNKAVSVLKKYSEELPLGQDTSGKSIMKRTYYSFENEDIIAVECYDWHESMQKSNPSNPDILSLSINTKELFSWIN